MTYCQNLTMQNIFLFIDESSEYNNLKLDRTSSYFMVFACHLGRYRYKQLPFRAAPAGNMFQRKIGETFKDMPNVFSIVDDIFSCRV